MAFGWFDTKQVDALAQWILDDLLNRVPAASLEQGGRKTSERLHRMNEAVSDRVREFASAQRPNFYQRARLANRVKWGMADSGYPDPFVTAFTSELITLVTVAGRSPRK
jgi:hypothetical protein